MGLSLHVWWGLFIAVCFLYFRFRCWLCFHDVRLWTEDDICHALQVEQRYARNRETLEPRLSLKEIALLHACSLEKQTFPQSLLNLVPNLRLPGSSRLSRSSIAASLKFSGI